MNSFEVLDNRNNMIKLVLLALCFTSCFAEPILMDETILTESILYYENSPATFICNNSYASWELEYGTNITECNCPGECGDILFDESRINAYCNESSPVLHFKQMKLSDNFKSLNCFEDTWNFTLLVGRESDDFYAEEPFALVDNNYTLICERSIHEEVYLYDDKQAIGTIPSYSTYVSNMDEENYDISRDQWNINVTIKNVALEDNGKLFGCYTSHDGLSLLNLTVNVSPINVSVAASSGNILYYENSTSTFTCDNTDAIWMVNDEIVTECNCPGKCGDILFDKSRINAYCNGSSPVLHFKQMKLSDNFKSLKCSEGSWSFKLLVGRESDNFYPEESFALADKSFKLFCEMNTYIYNNYGYLYDDDKMIGIINSRYYIENLDYENFVFRIDQSNITILIRKVHLKDDGKTFGCYIPGEGLSLLKLTVNVPVFAVYVYVAGYAIEGENKTFRCKVYNTKPEANFQWLLVENGSEREITQNINITSLQSGNLWHTTSTLKLKLKRSFQRISCRARIEEMAWKYRRVPFAVKVPVYSVSLHQTTGLFMEDENKVFVCKVDETGAQASIEWILSENGYERRITEDVHTTSKMNGNFYETTSILNLKLKRSFKTIKCRARILYMNWTVSTPLPLDIMYPPPGKPVISVNSSEICVGQKTLITCEWEGGYPNASLNFTCLSQTKTNTDFVTITETVTRQMSNHCRCEGEHIAKSELTTYHISIQSPVSSVSLHQESQNILIEDEYAIFVCKVDESESKAIFQWDLSENGSEREITQNVDITWKQNGKLWQTNSTLKLKLKRSFQTIKCRAKIQEFCWTNSTSQQLDVNYPAPGNPVITVNEPKLCVGEEILITCQWRGGHPSASLTLTCVSKTKTKNDYVMIREYVTREMNNSCRCEGKQIARNSSTLYDLSIQYPPNKVKINQTYDKRNVRSLICDASGGSPAVYNYSWTPGNYPANKEINISVSESSIAEITCTVSHKCKRDISSTLELFDNESNASLWLILSPTIAGIVIIISGAIICFKYRRYSKKKKKKAEENNRPQSEDNPEENIYENLDMHQKVLKDAPRRNIYGNFEMQQKEDNEERIYDSIESHEK